MGELFGKTVRCVVRETVYCRAMVGIGESYELIGPCRLTEAEARADLPNLLRAAVAVALPPAQWDDLTAEWQHRLPTADGSEAELVVVLEVWTFGDGDIAWEARAYLAGARITGCINADDPRNQADLATAKVLVEGAGRALFAMLWVAANAKALGIEEV